MENVKDYNLNPSGIVQEAGWYTLSGRWKVCHCSCPCWNCPALALAPCLKQSRMLNERKKNSICVITVLRCRSDSVVNTWIWHVCRWADAAAGLKIVVFVIHIFARWLISDAGDQESIHFLWSTERDKIQSFCRSYKSYKYLNCKHELQI